MTRFLFVILLSSLLTITSEASKENEKHGHSGQSKDSHSEDEKGHEEEEVGNIGPDKGITEVSERNGFKLSPEARRNFELKTQKLVGDGPWSIPRSARLYSSEEVNLFRLRAGFFKRIDFQTLRSTQSELVVDSDDMREGDEIILSGLGFLRIAELAATGGVAHGHSH